MAAVDVLQRPHLVLSHVGGDDGRILVEAVGQVFHRDLGDDGAGLFLRLDARAV